MDLPLTTAPEPPAPLLRDLWRYLRAPVHAPPLSLPPATAAWWAVRAWALAFWVSLGLGVCLGVCLFSLVGLPPLGGFWGKFVIAYAVFEAGAYHWVMYAVLVLAVANTVFSLFYYVRVLKRMFLDKAESAPRTVRVPLMSVTGTFCAGLAALVFLTGTFLVEPLTRTAREVAEILFL